VTPPRASAGEIRFGDRFSLTLQRTLRVPGAGGPYPLPPGLGPLPVEPAPKLGDRAPAEWRRPGSFVVPLRQGEALWLAFDAAWWKPNAVQVATGEVNALTGEPWAHGLRADPQNYLVCPDQLWLDGINTGSGTVRQFVAMPLGQDATVSEQLAGRDAAEGLRVRVFEPYPGRFPDEEPERPPRAAGPIAAAAGMGVAAGGEIHQRIHPDRHGRNTWDPDSATEAFVAIVNSAQYRALTGRPPPPSPVDAATYTEHGLPWFELYDETRGDIAGSDTLAGVEPVAGGPHDPLVIRPDQVRGIEPPGDG
jgi:hypothetical protein